MPRRDLRLHPALPLLQRGPDEWQIGIDPDNAVIIAHADDETVSTLRTLARGVATDHGAHPVLGPLLQLGVLTAARTLRRRSDDRVPAGDVAVAELCGRPDPGRARAAAFVRVQGSGAAAAPVAIALAAAGVGRVGIDSECRPVNSRDVVPGGLLAADLGSPWSDAVQTRIRAVGAAVASVETVDVAVLTNCADADVPWCDLRAAAAWLRADIPHLPILVAGRAASVGPFVRPGQGPCLGCLELTRTDRDRRWPLLADQLRTRCPGWPSGAAATGLRSAAVGIGVALVLEHLDDPGMAPDDGTAEVVTVRLPGCRIRTDLVVRHPLCGCAWPGTPVTIGL